MGVFNGAPEGPAASAGKPDAVMLDAAPLKAHRTASSLLQKGLCPAASAGPEAG